MAQPMRGPGDGHHRPGPRDRAPAGGLSGGGLSHGGLSHGGLSGGPRLARRGPAAAARGPWRTRRAARTGRPRPGAQAARTGIVMARRPAQGGAPTANLGWCGAHGCCSRDNVGCMTVPSCLRGHSDG
jgi:hypothetical protein